MQKKNKKKTLFETSDRLCTKKKPNSFHKVCVCLYLKMNMRKISISQKNDVDWIEMKKKSLSSKNERKNKRLTKKKAP